jgi:hypothetical protein
MATRTEAATARHDATAEFNSAFGAALVDVGEKFGLYTLLGSIGPATAEQLVECTGIATPGVRHWLHDQAAAGYLVHDPATDRFSVWCDINRN